MKHDTDQLSALVDGELDHETRDQLLGHLAHCADCRRVVEAERRLKAMLRGLPDPGPEPTMNDPVEQLVSAMTPPPMAPPMTPGSPASTNPAGPVPRMAPPRSRWLGPGPTLVAEPRPPVLPIATPEAERRANRRTRYAVGLVGVTGAFFGAAFAMGGEPTESPAPSVVPPVQQYSIEHARMTSGVPLSDPAGAPGALTDSAFAQFADR